VSRCRLLSRCRSVLKDKYRLDARLAGDVADLLHGMLHYDVAHRWSATEALQHPWLNGGHVKTPVGPPGAMPANPDAIPRGSDEEEGDDGEDADVEDEGDDDGDDNWSGELLV